MTQVFEPSVLGVSSAYIDADRTRTANLPQALVEPFKSRFGNDSVGEGNVVSATAYRALMIGAMILQEFDARKLSDIERARLTNCRDASVTQPVVGLKSRTLDGVAFTAPYLHNGSVPTLADLLEPAEKRPVTFYLGCRTYDEVRLGYRCDGTSEGAFLFDTRREGNRNTGHEYGVNLSPEEKAELLEFIKGIDYPALASPKNPNCH